MDQKQVSCSSEGVYDPEKGSYVMSQNILNKPSLHQLSQNGPTDNTDHTSFAKKQLRLLLQEKSNPTILFKIEQWRHSDKEMHKPGAQAAAHYLTRQIYLYFKQSF